MDGIHDLGGRAGFGPVDVNEPEVPFHEPWEGRLLGIVRAMTRPARWSVDWFRQVRERIDPVDYLTRPYYDQWLQTYAAMMVQSGVATVEELATGRLASPIPGLAPPMRPDDVTTAKNGVAKFDRPAAAPPAFAAGDRVRTRSEASVGHTRLAQYARGRIGRVEAYRGNHILPDSNARDDGYAEPLYTVGFAAAELWPETPAGSKDKVFLDLWESYLERV